MRSVPLSFTLLILTGGFASAGQDIRFVISEVAEVRSKNSDNPEFYVTNRLPKGTRVEVTAEEPGGWLAIKAPQGSFSYINTRFIKSLDPNGPFRVCNLPGVKVPVFVGSEVLTSRPTVAGCTLEQGAQLYSIGRTVNDQDGTWLQIRPPDRERRYIRAAFVAKVAPDGFAHSTFSPTGGKLVASTAPSANPGSSPGDLVRRAREAELAGQTAEAIKLYTQAGTDTATTHPAFSAQSLRYAQWLQDELRRKPPAVTVARTSATVALGAPAAPGATAAVSVPAPSTFVSTPNMPSPRVGNAQWLSYRGVLRRSGHSTVGVQLYTLDDPLTLAPLIEVRPVRGVNLDAYLTHTVTLSGWTYYRGDLRRNFMQASQVKVD
jgi:hypothetical protein